MDELTIPQKYYDELAAELEKCRTGIMCVTSDAITIWDVLTIAATLKDKILSREPDQFNVCTLVFSANAFHAESNNPITTLCGYKIWDYDTSGFPTKLDATTGKYSAIKVSNKYYLIDVSSDDVFLGKEISQYQVKGLMESLWDIFGGTVNEQGQKVVNPKVSATFAAFISMIEYNKIVDCLFSKDFVPNNCPLGVNKIAYTSFQVSPATYVVGNTAAPEYILEEGIYNNINKVHPGVYNKTDFDDSFYVKVDGNNLYLETDMQKFANQRLTRKMHFSPNSYPSLDKFNHFAGSIFEGWVEPSSAYTFIVTEDSIEVTLPKRNLPVEDYYTFVEQYLTNEITELYQNNPVVTLLFSGGVDSLTLMSIIMRLRLSNRTKLIYIKNHMAEDASFLEKSRLDAISASLEKLRPIVHSIEIHDITFDDVQKLIDDSDYYQFTSYCNTIISRRLPNDVFLSGEGANMMMLHTRLLSCEMFRNPANVEKFVKLQHNNYYSSGALASRIPNYNYRYINSDRTVIYNVRARYFDRVTKPNRIYYPFTTPAIMAEFRKLYLYNVDINVMLNAELPKYIIHKNVGDFFDSFITTEHGDDYDIFNKTFFNTTELDLTKLQILDNAMQHTDGARWMHEQVLQPTIEFNTITCIKLQQLVHKLVFGEG